MAFGIVCKHCGWYETDHEINNKEDLGDEAKVCSEGYSSILQFCEKYSPEDEKLHDEEKQKHDEERYRMSMRQYGHNI